MLPFKMAVLDGSPWIDYKEGTKSTVIQRFVFKVEDFLYFNLREVCVTYPCAVNGRSQLPLTVSIAAVSTKNQMTPIEIPPALFSSPSQNFRQGALDEDAQGQRKQPVLFNYFCDKGDNILVTVSGAVTGITVGCMIAGRKHGNPYGLD